ncbi:hypothetical protein [Sphingomonas sp. 28-63-12]|uniref:hypothetical protein n=1 Tax=Sphingomonas sp. 28-63-12 TaxID=1970434 RepID=UPI0035A84497
MTSASFRFPGEGRGPVARRFLARVAHDNIDPLDWTPACAGEALKGQGGAHG